MIKHRRKLRSLRLKDYDYSQSGWYFVTICTRDRKNIFGKIDAGKMKVNSSGEIVQACWHDLPHHYKCVLGEFVVMPNHIHGIVIIPGEDNDYPPHKVGVGLKPTPTETGLSEIVRGFKTFSSRRINARNPTPGRTIWQRGFYDHIIRDEDGLENITEYIRYNPRKWDEDRNNPAKGK